MQWEAEKKNLKNKLDKKLLNLERDIGEGNHVIWKIFGLKTSQFGKRDKKKYSEHWAGGC